ncbi:sodium:proton antiporter [Gordonia desulfuricans]|uniref:Sodium:proton antiporter n=1 Tax=Gordonia desulfuricans TaxID=89051 RepID=A0A7K3LM52_9ACTN|nr:cation:proton antiporter [Gordonia desulfuricans]NDK89325.1 sodium:proton antiporter [Gordonia desulfuricans]
MEQILIVIGVILLITAVVEIGPKVHVPSALALVVIGAVIGILPVVPAVHLDPEWILVGVLPPLLYATAVRMPAMEFRRDFGAISALSVVLVLISALVLGLFFWAVVPGISLATGVALGAIVSPTDAVATGIAKKLGVPSRVTAVLEGESLLNDASALVLLRAAVAAMAASISFGGVVLNFFYSVIVAVVIGAVIGMLNLRVRARITDPAVNTAISFTVPYLAYLPTEELGGSGLVAAVTAGLITGAGAVRHLTSRHRISDTQNWKMVEMLAEGGVFFLMGLELWGLIVDVGNEHDGVQHAVWLGMAALGVTLLVRAVYVVPLVWWLERRRRRGEALRPVLEGFTATPTVATEPEARGLRRRFSRWQWRFRFGSRRDPDLGGMTVVSPETAGRINARVTRALADIDYYDDAPIGPKEATIVVWAGLRGVVTVAAAQTLPTDTPARSLLVLTAFVVAAASLLIQGGTLSWVIRSLRLPDTAGDTRAERLRLRAEMDQTVQQVMATSDTVRDVPWLRDRIEQANREADDDEDGVGSGATFGLSNTERAQMRVVRREIIKAQRADLLRMRRQGKYSSETLSKVLSQLDAEEISLDLQGG